MFSRGDRIPLNNNTTISPGDHAIASVDSKVNTGQPVPALAKEGQEPPDASISLTEMRSNIGLI